jgi:hypothetical protein
MSQHPNRPTVVTLCPVILLVVDTVVTTEFLLHSQKSSSDFGRDDMDPRKALPTRFVIEERDCTIRLLALMNITNIHIIPTEVFDPQANDILFHIQNQSAEKT